MRSLLLEFLRLNDLATGIWREGDPYLVAAGSEYPIRQFSSPLEQERFLDLTTCALRYQGDAEGRTAALKEIGEIAANLLGSQSLSALSSGSFPLQLDLVVNPAEVAALPFEAATDGEGIPLFARADPAVVLTRRVRAAFAEASVRWPAKPRLLYAWAAPPGAGDVPAAAHGAALSRALGPWMPVPQGTGDSGGTAVLATLAEATLAQLEEACRTAVAEKKPFTHVHLLAHGYPIGQAHKQRFGMALHGEDGDLHAVTPEEIEQALKPLVGHTCVMTLATCDAANLTNTITSKRSVAHGLHELGFPVVVASQFPLTVPGSTLMVETFYKALLGGQDVRIALHQARLALYEKRQTTGHDWASLVGYVRLPEGYADHLLDVRLESNLASLKTIQGWSDSLINQGGKDPALFERAATELQQRSEALLEFLGESGKTSRRGVFEENLGLLGSAEKRLAEVCFARSRLGEGAHWQQLMREALARSRDWYRQAYRRNLSHHWTGVQQLSLEAALAGRIANPGHWHAAVTAADIDRENGSPGEVIWALGSLVELYLLAPLAGQALPVDATKHAVSRMKALVLAQPGGDTFPLESTARQFRRYVGWWTSANGFFPGRADLAAEAGALVQELNTG
jgi:hypothetical protein